MKYPESELAFKTTGRRTTGGFIWNKPGILTAVADPIDPHCTGTKALLDWSGLAA